jgi:hypothetical protein
MGRAGWKALMILLFRKTEKELKELHQERFLEQLKDRPFMCFTCGNLFFSSVSLSLPIYLPAKLSGL